MNLFYNVVFMLMGVVVTYSTLDARPRDEWFWAAVGLGLALTTALVVVEVAFQLIRRRQGHGESRVLDRAPSAW